MKEEILQEEKGINYMDLALCAFAGLGVEVIYAFLLWPIIFGSPLNGWTANQHIIHWVVTSISWGIISYIILRSAKKKYEFDIFESGEKVKVWQWLCVILLVLFSVLVSYLSWNGFKVIKEFQYHGAFKLVFQYIYYFFETILFILILVFGQKACEAWFKNKNIPYGGVVLGLTWGLAHILTQGSLSVGLLSALGGFTYGIVYLLLNRDMKKTVPLVFIMFVL